MNDKQLIKIILCALLVFLIISVLSVVVYIVDLLFAYQLFEQIIDKIVNLT